MTNTILSYVVPVISVALTYFFGRRHADQSDQKKAYREAYDSFYLPFITLLYQTQIWWIGFARLSPKDRHKIFALIEQNIKYMNEGILEYVDILYGHYGAILGKEMLDIDSILTHDRADEIFDSLTERVLFQATWLAKKLRQPQIGKLVQELYDDGREKREMQLKKQLQHDGRS